VSAAGGALPVGVTYTALDARGLAVARAARARGEALLDLGAVWDPILFAAPQVGTGDVMVARLPAETSARLRARPAIVYAGLACADALVFGAFGFALLRRRVVAPLEALAEAAREIGEAGTSIALQLDGPREARAVAVAMHEMSASLIGRTKELSDTVVELRVANDDLRRTRAGLERAERLASVGRLAAGVAHEVGNPLGAILAFAELVMRDPRISPASRGQLERVLREGERVRTILRQLLDLARPVRAESRPFDLGTIANEAIGLVSAQSRYASIAFLEESRADVGLALGDAAKANQVLLNLLLNAAEAVQSQPSPRILVLMQPCVLRRRRGDVPALPLLRARPDAIECVVADNGCGVPEEDRERIFDPFFTTRAAGEGTGLGLPNALRMAEEQGGSLELEVPPPGYRTAFALRVPCANAVGGSVRSI
jgi:signal transduction histidine kinase